MYSDIEEARSHHDLLRQIVDRHATAATDYRALRRVLDLCRRATGVIDDRYCRDKLRRTAARSSLKAIEPLRT